MTCPAVTRGMELLTTKMTDLPLGALQGAHALGQKIGLCGEVYLTAYCYYAQLQEGLKCEDEAYLFRPGDTYCQLVKGAIDQARMGLPTRYYLHYSGWDVGKEWEVPLPEFDKRLGTSPPEGGTWSGRVHYPGNPPPC